MQTEQQEPEPTAVVSKATLDQLIRVAMYVSRGRGYVGVRPYPDTLARRALGALDGEGAVHDRRH